MRNSDIDIGTLPISERLRKCAENMLEYEFSEPEIHIANCPDYLPHNRLAAVLILLYERDNAVRVLLTTRSKELRSHSGEVALPGGKCDVDDRTPFDTSLREANEEVGLPRNHPHIHILCTLPPFLSAHLLIVTPVVALLSDTTMLEHLVPNPGEVANIFDHPLEAFLDPEIMRSEPDLSPADSPNWPYAEEFWNVSDRPFLGRYYRLTRLRTTSTPVEGLTASIMILAAQTAFRRPPSFPQYADDPVSFSQSIATILREYEAKSLDARKGPKDSSAIWTDREEATGGEGYPMTLEAS